MSLLPTALDTRLSEKDIDAARKAILAASGPNRSENGYATIALPLRLTADQKTVFHDAQKCYENMEWPYLQAALMEMKNWRVKLPKQIESRLLLSQMMTSTETTLATTYHDAAAHLKLDVANGDLYIGMALLKVGEYDVADCASLLTLAELCPSSHPGCLRLAHEKLRLLKLTSAMHVYTVDNDLKTPEDVQWYKNKFPEVKAASSAVDEAVKEWHSSSHLEKYRLLLAWTRTPSLAPLSNVNRRLNLDTFKCDSTLLSMPENIFAKIMEYSGQRTMLNVANSSWIGVRRVNYTPAWNYHASINFGVPVEQVIELGPGPQYWRYILEQLVLLKSLEHANMWDYSSFDYFLSRVLTPIEEPGSYQPFMPSFNQAFSGLTQIFLFDVYPPFVIEWLVSNSNFHMTLARLSLSADRQSSSIFMIVLFLVLNRIDSFAVKWTQELIDAGFHHALLIRAGKSESHEAIKLLAYLKLHHVQRACPSHRTLGHYFGLLSSVVADDEQKETSLKLLPGVYHLAGYRIRDWEETTMAPFFASFQVEPRHVSVAKGDDPLYDEEDDDDALHFEFPDHMEGATIVKMIGHGRYVDENGEISLVELKFSSICLAPDNMTMQATIGGKARMSFMGSLTDFIVGGEIAYWDDDTTDPTAKDFLSAVPGGAFLLWKSALPDTEANWKDVHIRDIDALSKLRSAGGFEYERKEAFLVHEKPSVYDLPVSDRPSDDDIRHEALLVKAKYDIYTDLAVHSELYAQLQASASSIIPHVPAQAYDPRTLPKGPYETAEAHNLRVTVFTLIQTQTRTVDRPHIIAILHTGLDDLITLCSAMKRLFMQCEADAVLEDHEQSLLNAYFDIHYIHPLLLDRHIKEYGEVIEQLKSLRERYGTGPLPPEALLDRGLIAAVNLVERSELSFLGAQTLERKLTPVKAAKASATLLNFLLKDYPSESSTVASAAPATATNESSPLCKAIVDEYSRLDSQNDFAKLIRKWSYRLGTAHPSLDPASENIVPLLIVTLLNAILPLPNRIKVEDVPSEYSTDDESESYSDSDDETGGVSTHKAQPQSFGLSSTATIAIGAVAAVIGLGAFALGRWQLNKPKSSNL